MFPTSSTTAFFDEKDEREASLWSILEGLLVGKVKWQGTVRPGGVWLEDFFAYLVVETKNEQGLGRNPFIQGLIVYGKVVAQEKVISPSRPFGSAEVPPTVSPVRWVVKPTGCSARPGEEPSRCISCHFRRRHLCR